MSIQLQCLIYKYHWTFTFSIVSRFLIFLEGQYSVIGDRDPFYLYFCCITDLPPSFCGNLICPLHWLASKIVVSSPFLHQGTKWWVLHYKTMVMIFNHVLPSSLFLSPSCLFSPTPTSLSLSSPPSSRFQDPLTSKKKTQNKKPTPQKERLLITFYHWKIIFVLYYMFTEKQCFSIIPCLNPW